MGVLSAITTGIVRGLFGPREVIVEPAPVIVERPVVVEERPRLVVLEEHHDRH